MFNFSFDKKTMYVIAGIMLLAVVVQYIADPQALIALLLTAPGVLVAITFHEFAHGYAAYKLGDDTAKNEGRLSLNPFDHLDPIGTLMLLVAGFGWGKPVHVNPTKYSRKMSMEKGEAIVSAAGPLMNFILAIVLTIVMYAVAKATNTAIVMSDFGFFISASNITIEIIVKMLFYAVTINIGLGVFNLIPLPPLDGSKIIMPFLPYKAKQWFINNEQIFYIVFVILFVTRISGMIISPVINGISNGMFSLGKLIFRM